MLNKVKFLSFTFFIFLGCGDSPSVVYVAPYEGCMDPDKSPLGKKTGRAMKAQQDKARSKK